MPGRMIRLGDDHGQSRFGLPSFLRTEGYAVWHGPTRAVALIATEWQQPDLIPPGLGSENSDAKVLAKAIRRRPTTGAIPTAVSADPPLSGRHAACLASISVRIVPTQATPEPFERGNGRPLPLCPRLIHASPPCPAQARPTGAVEAAGLGRTSHTRRLTAWHLGITAPATHAAPESRCRKSVKGTTSP
jgi:hypothetical protein